KSSPTSTRTSPAKARTKPIVRDDDEDDEDDRRIRKSRKRRSRAPQAVIRPWIAGGAAVLLIGVGVTLFFVLRYPKEPDKVPKKEEKQEEKKPPIVELPPPPAIDNDLDLVNLDGLGVVTIQLGDWWNTAAGQKLRQQFATLNPDKE